MSRRPLPPPRRPRHRDEIPPPPRLPSLAPPARSPWSDPKVLAAVVALVTTLAGGVELRVQVGLLASRLDRIESELRAGRYSAGLDP